MSKRVFEAQLVSTQVQTFRPSPKLMPKIMRANDCCSFRMLEIFRTTFLIAIHDPSAFLHIS